MIIYIYMMNAKVVTKDKNKAMLLVDGNKQLGMTQTFSVFFKHLFVVIIYISLQYHNHTQQWLVSIFYKLKEELCAKKLMCLMEPDIVNLTTFA